MGLICPLDCLPPDLPTKNPPTPVVPATSRYEKSTTGPDLGPKSVSFPSAHVVWMVRCWASFLLPSRNRVAFQLFLTCACISSFRVSAVSFGETSWLVIAVLFLDFHIAQASTLCQRGSATLNHSRTGFLANHFLLTLQQATAIVVVAVAVAVPPTAQGGRTTTRSPISQHWW